MRHLGHVGQLVVLVGLEQDAVTRAYDIPAHVMHGRVASAQHQRIIALQRRQRKGRLFSKARLCCKTLCATHIEKDVALEGRARPHPAVVPLGHHIRSRCRRLCLVQFVTDTSGTMALLAAAKSAA